MITITLIRNKQNSKAVTGTIAFPLMGKEGETKTFEFPTLENADFIIPAGTYPVERTWSPKFKKFLPLIDNVPDREGIRIHRGSIPEHSKGCILLDIVGMSHINVLFNQLDNIEENAQIEIIDPCTA